MSCKYNEANTELETTSLMC